MAPRANWKGYLKLSLVSCPIALYPATSASSKISFHRINTETRNRLRQQNVDAESGDLVDREHTGRGYEVAKGEYLQVSDDELEEIRIESTHTIDIDRFVPRDQVDERLHQRAVLHRPHRAGRPGGICGHSRGDPGHGHGRARPRGAGAARARDAHRALREGAARDHPALPL